MLLPHELWAAAAGTTRVLGLPPRQAAAEFRELEPLMAMGQARLANNLELLRQMTE